MKLFIFFLLVITFFQPTEDSILWNENEKLSWNDFKGTPISTINAAALTASGLIFDFSAKTSQSKLIELKQLLKQDSTQINLGTKRNMSIQLY